MSSMKIVDKADLGVYYDADICFMNKAWLQKVGLTKDIFIEMYRTNPSIGFEADGKQFGGAMMIDNSVHVAVLPEYQRRWSSLLRGLAAWIFSVQDPLIAKIPVANKVSVEFVRRQGWRCIAEDAAYITFELSLLGAPRSRFIRSLQQHVFALRNASSAPECFENGTDANESSLILNNRKADSVA